MHFVSNVIIIKDVTIQYNLWIPARRHLDHGTVYVCDTLGGITEKAILLFLLWISVDRPKIAYFRSSCRGLLS